MFRKALSLILVLAFAISMSGCASIVSGNNQKLYIATNPPGATIKINDRTRTSPVEFSLNTWKSGFVVKISKEGYEPLEIDVERKVNAWAALNLFFGPLAVVAFPVDFISGNAWKFTPTKINETLTPIQTPTQPIKK